MGCFSHIFVFTNVGEPSTCSKNVWGAVCVKTQLLTVFCFAWVFSKCQWVFSKYQWVFILVNVSACVSGYLVNVGI